MTIARAFMITGGTEQQRQAKYGELVHGDIINMYASYKKEGVPELGIIFSDAHGDFKDMSLEKVRTLAGDAKLPAETQITTFAPSARFGIIDLSAKP
jgi:hypothetical protein